MMTLLILAGVVGWLVWRHAGTFLDWWHKPTDDQVSGLRSHVEAAGYEDWLRERIADGYYDEDDPA